MLRAVLMTATVSPLEGLPVVRFVTVPVTVAAKAEAAARVRQRAVEKVWIVLVEIGTA
jgi:hypothetical protein